MRLKDLRREHPTKNVELKNGKIKINGKEADSFDLSKQISQIFQ